MKISFSAGTIATEFAAQGTIAGLSVEDALVTFECSSTMDNGMAAAGLVAYADLMQAAEEAGAAEEFELANSIRHLANSLLSHVKAATAPAIVEEPTAPDTGSHSLPTGDASIKGSSQANSDVTHTNEEFSEDGNEAQKQPDRRGKRSA